MLSWVSYCIMHALELHKHHENTKTFFSLTTSELYECLMQACKKHLQRPSLKKKLYIIVCIMKHCIYINYSKIMDDLAIKGQTFNNIWIIPPISFKSSNKRWRQKGWVKESILVKMDLSLTLGSDTCCNKRLMYEMMTLSRMKESMRYSRQKYYFSSGHHTNVPLT